MSLERFTRTGPLPGFRNCCGEQTHCVDSRPAQGRFTRRRYRCLVCDARYTTYEMGEADPRFAAPLSPALEEYLRGLTSEQREAVSHLLRAFQPPATEPTTEATT